MVWRLQRVTAGQVAGGRNGTPRRRLRCSVLLLAATGLALAGCGNDASNRVGGATAGGAATGATIGLIGGPIGVIVGGAIGGGIAALTAQGTTPKQVDLGNPPWDRGASGSSPQAAPSQARNGTGQTHRQVAAASANTSSSGSDYAGSGYGAQNSQAQSGQPQNLLDAGGVTGGGSIQSKPLPPPS